MKNLARAATLSAVLCLTLGVLNGSWGSREQPAAPPSPAALPAPGFPSAIPSAPLPLPAPDQVGRPTRIAIPAIGVAETLLGVGLKPDGAMQTPDFGKVGWFQLGPRPGAAGPAVIVAHVHGPAGDDVFADLDQLEPGDEVTVERTDGATVFIVDAIEQTPKESLPTARIWNQTQRAVLRLITCGGTPDPVTRMYPENTVVYAHAIRGEKSFRKN